MAVASPGYRRYAVRRVNPFEGVLQVIESGNARAYSPNGRVWQVQVLAPRPEHTWRSGSKLPSIEQFFNFGRWDTEQGLHRIPANPVMDIGAMQAAAGGLVAALAKALTHLPFPLVDEHEYWSVDSDGRLVALLATTEDPARVKDIRVTRWLATRATDQGFVSPTLLELGIPAQGEPGPRQHAEQLELKIRQQDAQRAWYLRSADGSGHRLQPEGDEEPLPPSAFPSLGLKIDWGDELTTALSRDYIEWNAPRLLMLQRISRHDRSWLEEAACRQAVELASSRRLYPEVIDAQRLEAACVEAKLRSSR